MHADEDKKKREMIESRNKLESAIYQAEKMPDEFKDKISDEDKKAIADAVEEAKKHQKSEDKDELEAAFKALNDVIMPIGSKMYEAASKENESKTEPKEGESKSEEPLEGEVIDDKKEK